MELKINKNGYFCHFSPPFATLPAKKAQYNLIKKKI